MSMHASLITMGVISAISGTFVIYERVAQINQPGRDFSFEITGNGAMIFGIFMLLVGIVSIVYGIISLS